MDKHIKVLIKRDDAAKMLAVSVRKLWSLTKGGEIPVIQIGKSVRYDPDDIHRYVAKNRTGGT